MCKGSIARIVTRAKIKPLSFQALLRHPTNVRHSSTGIRRGSATPRQRAARRSASATKGPVRWVA